MWWHAHKPDLVFRRKRRVHLNWRRRQFNRLLAAEVCASAVVMLDTPRSEVVWRVLVTHSIRQFPLPFPSRASPCGITFQLESNITLKTVRRVHTYKQLATDGTQFHLTALGYAFFFFFGICVATLLKQQYWIQHRVQRRTLAGHVSALPTAQPTMETACFRLFLALFAYKRDWQTSCVWFL